jgi:hypothetical protein
MLVRVLKLQLTGPGTLVGALNALLTQKWAASVVNGQTVLSTSEAGGSVTFTFERAHTPAELAVMAEEALEWVNTLADPENPQMSEALRPLSSTNRSGISPPNHVALRRDVARGWGDLRLRTESTTTRRCQAWGYSGEAPRRRPPMVPDGRGSKRKSAESVARL